MTDINQELSKAVFNDDAELINKLISEGADVNGVRRVGVWGETPPLMKAVYRGKYSTVRALVEYGADVNRTFLGYTHLHVAATYGRKDVVGLLVCSGADIDAMNRRQETALHAAAKACYEDVYNFLIERGARTNIECAIFGLASECLRLAKIAKENNGGVWPPVYDKK